MNDNVSQIKQKLDIVDVISGYVEIKKSGKNYKGLCPFHGEKTPSFMVSQELQMYKCFGCGESGDIFSFVQKLEGIEFPSALQILADKAGVTLQKTDFDKDAQRKKELLHINEITCQFYEHILWNHPTGKEGLDYLKTKRQLTDKTIKSFRLGYAPNTWDGLYKFLLKKGFKQPDLIEAGVIVKKQRENGSIDKFRGRITFPLMGIDNKVLGFSCRTIFNKDPKYLNTPETPVFHKSSLLYGLNKAKVEIKTKGVVFVEGNVDVISAHQAGLSNVVASLGTSLTPDHLKLISRYTKEIIFCFDSDSAGIKAIYRGINLAEKEDFNIKIASIPREYQDLDELVRKDPDLAKKIILDAVSAYDFFIADAFSKFDKTTADGKKRIIDHLKPLIGQISNNVLFEHYSKYLATELDINQATVESSLRQQGNTDKNPQINPNSAETSQLYAPQYSTQAYFLSLVLKAENIDIPMKYVYKLTPDAFDALTTREIFENLRKLPLDTQKLNIEKVCQDLSEEAKQEALDLHMYEFGEASHNHTLLEKELNNAFERIQKEWAKKKMHNLGQKIKIAEMKNDIKEIQDLTKEIEEVSKLLI